MARYSIGIFIEIEASNPAEAFHRVRKDFAVVDDVNQSLDHDRIQKMHVEEPQLLKDGESAFD